MPDLAIVAAAPATTTPYRLTVRRRHGRGVRRESETILVYASDEAELQEIIRAFPGRVDWWERAKLHECSACWMRAPWGPSWGWYGSYAEMEDGKPVVKLCSDACWSDAKRRGIIPPNASRDALDA